MRTIDRHLIKGLHIKLPASFFFVFTSPLFEKEGHFSDLALLLNIQDPFRVHEARFVSALSSYDDPVDAAEFEVW